MVLLALLAVPILATSGEPDHCSVGDDLGHARLLEPAANAYNRGDNCSESAIARIDRRREISAAAFADADLYLAAGEAARKEAAAAAAATPPDRATRKRARERARAADTKAAKALVRGLQQDATQESEAGALGELVGNPTFAAASVTTRCRLAQSMVTAGLLEDASQMLSTVVLKDPAAECPETVDALRTARTRGRSEAALAAAAEEEGNDDSARTHHSEAFRADGSLTASSAALLAPTDDDNALEAVGDALDEALDWLGSNWDALLVALIALGIFGLVLFRALRAMAWRRKGFRDWLAPEGTESGLARRIARLRVRFAAFEGGDDDKFSGADATAVVGDFLDQPGGGRFPFDRMPTSAADTDPLSAVADVLGEAPHGAIAKAALKAVGPLVAPRTAVINGRLVPQDASGAGIALSVTGPDGRVAASETLRENLIDPEPGAEASDGWARLMPAAGAWLRHHLRALGGADAEAADQAAWRAEALAQAGQYWSAEQDWARAATCFTRSIEADPTLLSSYDALAVTLIRQEQYAPAGVLLDRLLETLANDDAARRSWPALEESAYYHAVIALVYEGLE